MKRRYDILKFTAVVIGLAAISGCSMSPEQKVGHADKLFTAAQIYVAQQKYDDGIRALREAIGINTTLKRDSAVGDNYFLLANAQRLTCQYDSAVAAYKLALEYFRLTGEKKSERTARLALAEFYYSAGEYEYAATLANDAAASAKFFNDTADHRRGLSIAARAFHQLGHYNAEVGLLDSLAAGEDSPPDQSSQTDILNLKLEAYAAAGNYELARRTFSELMDASERDTLSSARAWYTMGRMYQSMNRTDSSVRCYSRTLGFLSGPVDRALETNVLISLGNIAYRSKHYDQAKRYYHNATVTARLTENIVAQHLLEIAAIACDWKNENVSSNNIVDEFIKHTSSIGETCHQEGDFPGEAFADILLGRFAERNNDIDSALKYYRSAQLLEEQHLFSYLGDVVQPELLETVLEGEPTGWYDANIQIDCVRDSITDAFAFLEQKNLADLIHFFSRLTMRTSDANLNLQLARLEWKRNTLVLLENDILQELCAGKQKNPERLRKMQELLPHRVEELSMLADSIAKLNLNYRWLVYPKQIAMKEIQSTLPPNSALLEYAPLASGIYCIVLTRDSVYVRKSSANRQAVIPMVQEYNRLIGDSRLNMNSASLDPWATLDRLNELSQALYNILLAPVMPLVGNMTTMYIVPPLEFGWLPFHTLRGNGTTRSSCIFDNMNVEYLPSAAALFFKHTSPRAVNTIIGFGHQGRTTWDIEYELKDIRSFYDKAKMIFDTAATVGRLMHAQCDLLHIGGEFLVDQRIPNNSVMVLSDGVTPDGVRDISFGELLGMDTQPAIIFSDISPTPGELSRYTAMGFLANGTPTFIATMWQGERKSKKYFGEMFYTSLMTGMLPAQAYQRAMSALPKREEFSRQYQWGLFYLFGGSPGENATPN